VVARRFELVGAMTGASVLLSVESSTAASWPRRSRPQLVEAVERVLDRYLAYRREGFYQEWNRRYRAALGRESQEPRQRTRVGQPYIPHPEREHQLASAVEIARLVLNTPDLYEPQRRKVLAEVLWFATQVDGKYTRRFRSNAARALAASERKQLRHDHVLTRKELIDALLREPERVDEIVRSALGCVVTKEEHDRLSALPGSHRGWDRYIAARIDVCDEEAGVPFIYRGKFRGQQSPRS
jgi:hypothetical protein